ENSSWKQYIQKLEKAKDEVEDTADKSQQIVEEHLRK
ncbi:TPA: DNA-directed RNA polymerase subunit omega, partial [Enterococcus faecium]